MSLPVFSQSFRICFLLAALWAAAVIPVWLVAYTGGMELGGPYGAAAWHAHELVYGYVALVIAGFLFTAIPNWTGRPPLGPGRIKLLIALWLAGRAAVMGAGAIGVPAAAVTDSLFLIAVMATAAREIISGGNYRNLVVVALVSLLLASNIWFHIEAWEGGHAHQHASGHAPLHAGIAIVIALIVLIGGRIVPNFTRNWLSRRGAAHLPAMPSRFDMAAAAAGAIALASWVIAPGHVWMGVLAFVAAVLLFIRLARWRGWETGAEPLLAVLHIGYFFVPLGFLLIAASAVPASPIPPDAALHAWTAGAVGVMTLAVMTRASLGHTGRPLAANAATTAIYAAVIAAAVLRVAAPLVPEHYIHFLGAAGAAWTLAFAGFVAVYGPLLLRPRTGA